MRRSLAVCAALVLAAACSDRPPLAPPGYPELAISDATHNDGNPDFFFLPPLVPDPSGDPRFEDGAFNPDLSPVVEVCRWAEVVCAEVVAQFTRTSGTGSQTIDVAGERYVVTWNTDDSNLDLSQTYRIRVLLEGQELGYADVDVVSSRRELRSVQTGESIGLVGGHKLSIRFRIEHDGVIPPANQAPEVSAGPDQAVTLPNAATLAAVVTDDGLPAGSTLTISWSAVSGPGTVTFGDASAASTTASFSAPGDYLLRLSATDGELPASDDVAVAVSPAPSGGPLTWTNAANDHAWLNPANWDQARIPGPDDDVIIPFLSSTPVSHGAGASTIKSLTSDAPLSLEDGATLTVIGSAVMNGAVLTLNGGSLQGATVSGSGAMAVSAGLVATLDGVTLAAGMVLTVPGGGVLQLRNGLTLDGQVTVAGTGASAVVSAQETQTVGGTGVISLEGTGNFLFATGASPTLTLGPTLTVRGRGAVGNGTSQLVNQGTIRADLVGQMLTVTNVSNSGTLRSTNGATLGLLGTWTNAAGTVGLDGTAMVNLGGTFTPAQLGSWTRTGGTVNLTGTLTNTGNTLDVDASGVGTLRLQGGTIVGGTLVLGSLGSPPVAVLGSGTLDGVTLASGVGLALGSGMSLTLRNGLTLDGVITLTIGGAVSAFGSQTLGGVGEVVLATSSFLLPSAGTTLTLGAGLTVRGAGTVGSSSAQLVNQGTIRADLAGQTLAAANLTNAGVVRVNAGAVITVTGNFTTQAGGTVSVGIGGTATSQFGRITITSAAALDGTLVADLVSGFVPAAGDRFRRNPLPPDLDNSSDGRAGPLDDGFTAENARVGNDVPVLGSLHR